MLAGLTVIAYIPTFIWMVDRWSVADTYYSHGFLVPLISLFIVWTKRDKLFDIPMMFYVMNAAAVVGLYKFVTNRQSAVWERIEETDPEIPDNCF